MQSQANLELQFSKFSGGACSDPPLAGRKNCSNKINNKTRSNFGLDPRLAIIDTYNVRLDLS